ncbi:MAG TPA: polysaccharide pyruvyl transferase family protein [Methanobacteriaceae archaeon]|nr:polysaccharide pyruvyl transferase family protein [Methanobacteriaceae archaeon]
MVKNSLNQSKRSSSKINANFGKKKVKVLLVGYNGANNTGSEARLHTIIDDLKELLGEKVEITVPTLNQENLRRYLKETETIKIAHLPSIYFFTMRKLVKEHDVVILVEGSCYMDTWTSALLWAFLWATKCAHDFKKPSLAYAVDAGKLSTLNKKLVQREASKTDLIITRNYDSQKILKSVGVSAPLEVTADCAFEFKIDANYDNILKELWPEAENQLVGLSVVDFYQWPVVIRPWGRSQDQYRWPYYFSRSKKRDQLREELAKSWACLADEFIQKHRQNIALICMEDLDEPLARKILDKMKHPDKARIFSSNKFNASEMTVILRKLNLLVTSRYHASVLSLAHHIPQIAIGHDTRLKTLYKELGIYDDYFIYYGDPDLWEKVHEKSENLLKSPEPLKITLKTGYEEQLKRANNNKPLLKDFLKKFLKKEASP